MFYRKALEEELEGVTNLEGMIDAFENMCAQRSGLFDDMLLIESGNFDYSGETEFYVSLARRYKDSAFAEEFTVLQLDIIYPPVKIGFKNRRILKRHYTSDQTGGSFSRFFQKVRSSPLIAYINENRMQYLRYEITEEESN